jgi:putative flippase GtrA
LSVLLLFRRKARWNSALEIVIFLIVIGVISQVDLYSTRMFVRMGFGAALAKMFATAIGLVLNFAGRRFIVFPEKPSDDWKPQAS